MKGRKELLLTRQELGFDMWHRSYRNWIDIYAASGCTIAFSIDHQ